MHPTKRASSHESKKTNSKTNHEPLSFLKGKEPVPDEILHLGDIDDGQGIHMSVPPKKQLRVWRSGSMQQHGSIRWKKMHLETFDKQRCREVM